MPLKDHELKRRFNPEEPSSDKMELDLTLAAVNSAFVSFVGHMNDIIPEGDMGMGRLKALMFTELENAQMWAIKAVKDRF